MFFFSCHQSDDILLENVQHTVTKLGPVLKQLEYVGRITKFDLVYIRWEQVEISSNY